MTAHTLGQMLGHRAEVRSVLPDVSIASTRHVGIEIEVECGHKLSSARDSLHYWEVVEDSSLRNSGAELRCVQPLAGNDLHYAIKELAATFYKHKELEVTERTSMHVHVDVRDLFPNQIGKILVAYVLLEAALYNAGGKHRYDNIYCPGVTNALEQVPLMRNVVACHNRSILNYMNEWCKYTGINLRSVLERGSIEFRAHQGTVSASEVLKWVNALLKVVAFAIEYQGTVQDMVAKASNDGPTVFGNSVFGSTSNHILGDGVYAQHFKNNLINALDIVNEYGEYHPEPAVQGGNEADRVVEALRRAILSRSEEVAPTPQTLFTASPGLASTDMEF